MEIKEADDAIKDSHDWLLSAKLQRDNGLYNKAVYSLEMSLEIAMKAVLIAMHKDFPKKHDVSDILEENAIANKNLLPKGFSEDLGELLPTFRSLLRLRNVSGYSFGRDLNESLFRKEVSANFDKVVGFVESCGKAVKALKKSK